MKTFGLIGFPLSHSFSKKYFTEKFQEEGIHGHQYELFPIENIHVLPKLLEDNPLLCGLNVTIPYKVSVLPFLDEVDVAAERIGAVNCIDFEIKNGKRYLKGYNTDALGFEESLKPCLKQHHTKALIFGDGGAAKAVKYVLSKLGIEYKSVVRKPMPGNILYEDVTREILDTHKLLVNTTPLGMSPNVHTFPDIDYNFLNDGHLAYDLVYNPLETAFLNQVAKQGGQIKNGLEMLHKQAEISWEIWSGQYRP